MDINFHYFAVKAVARYVGFSDDDAQKIAFYSQAVDDCNMSDAVEVRSVPDYVKHLSTKAGAKLGIKFYPVTTGFISFFDNVALGLKKNQKWILSPFHFIPMKCYKEAPANRVELRTAPAELHDGSLISVMLDEAKKSYIDEPEKKQENLIRIGALLHTFADTYAHQNFSAYHGWENYAKLDKVISNIDNTDITEDYKYNLYYKSPSVGHVNIDHAPDDTYATVYYSQCSNAGDDYSEKYSRSNTREFTMAAKTVADYLCECLGKPRIDEGDWVKDFAPNLVKGFFTKSKVPSDLAAHWKKVFSEYSFSYDFNEFMSEYTHDELVAIYGAAKVREVEDAYAELGMRFAMYKVNDDFYKYNYFCDKTRNKVVGETYKI
jgi:hypothetical protein